MKTKMTCVLAVALALVSVMTSYAQTNFTKITTGAIVTDGGASGSCAWGDYDNDGYLDLFVSNADIGAGGRNFLYHNNRDGTFARTNSSAIANDVGNFRGCAWVDYDNDGNLDLSVVSRKTRNILYRNNGGGVFNKITTNSIFNDLQDSLGGSWADYDRDGFIDFFVANTGSVKNSLYHNNGNDTFKKITSGTIANDVGISLSCAWADYDNDHNPDLFVSNFLGPKSFLYHNRGDGTFLRVVSAAVGGIVTNAANSIGSAWGDYDNDGFLDLFVANDGVLNNNGSPSFLFHNNGDGTFTEISSDGLEEGPTRSPSCAWADYDNDGYLDLLVLNNDDYNILYHNEGDGTFRRVTEGVIVNDGGPGYNSSACSWADYDNDGFLDLFIANGSGPSGAGPAAVDNFLYHNDRNSNAWIKIKCVGTVSNRSAIGAKVRVTATIHGKTIRQLREVTMGDGFQSGSPLDTHFGLGDATNIDLVRIEWPSGTVQEFPNVPARQYLIVTEAARLAATSSNGTLQFTLQGGRNLEYDLQSSSNLTTWSTFSTVTVTNLDGTVPITDTNSPAGHAAFYRALLRPATVTVFATGLNNPRGLKFGPDGNLYVAEGGAGGTLSTVGSCGQVPAPIGPYTGGMTARISRINPDGTRSTVVDDLPSSATAPASGGFVSGVADLAFIDNTLYALLAGAGCSHGLAGTDNTVLRVNPDGTTAVVADLSVFQKANPVKNPEPDDFEPDGTWYSMVAVGGTLYAIEPNHGELAKITPSGAVERVADISASQGHIVPTAIAYQDDFYVGNLGTFPIKAGTSKILKITSGGEVTVAATGFTTVLALAFDRQKRLYVLENSTCDNCFPTPGTGRLSRIDPSGRVEEIASGLLLPTAMTFGPDGSLYVSDVGFGPPATGLGQVLKITIR